VTVRSLCGGIIFVAKTTDRRFSYLEHGCWWHNRKAYVCKKNSWCNAKQLFFSDL